MTTILSQSTDASLVTLQATETVEKKPILFTKNSNSRTVLIEYNSSRSFMLQYKANREEYETTSDLLKRVIEKLNTLNQTKELTIDITGIVSLETKNKDLKIDYLLSLEDKPLDFLKDGAILVPYFAPPVASSTHSLPTLEDYEFLSAIGQGGFATVYLARKKQSGKFFAIKQIKKNKLTPKDRKNLLQERNAMVDVDSPFVAKLYSAFQTENYCYLVMDYMFGGDLLSFIESSIQMTEENAKLFIAEIALGLDGLHSQNIVYRDLKSENVLTDREGHVVLSDFGLSKKQLKDELNYSLCGTPQFVAPEVYKKTGYTHLVDYFSLGVLTFELVTGDLPFVSDNLQSLALKIVKDDVKFKGKYTEELQDFIIRLLAKKPTERLGAKNGVDAILSHPWMKSIDIEALKARKLRLPKLPKVNEKLKLLPKGFIIEKPVTPSI